MHHADRLAGPDHELVALRRVQPDAVALAGELAAGDDVADRPDRSSCSGYVTFTGPYFPAIWILRKLQAKHGLQAFVSRHPLISLGALVLVIGFIFDAMLEVSLVRTGLYIYSQTIPFRNPVPGQHIPVPFDLGSRCP